jgi:16S rRNA (adenine1518-N6/adenine1519-N6)-dimethyltransferase
MLVMVQREVAERFCATPRSEAYGAVSVKVAYWATSRVAGTVPASVFVPRPNVESALAEIVRRPEPATDADREVLFHLVRVAFGQRRKMLRRSLAADVDSEVFAAAGIDPQRRPEELDVVEWGALAHALARARAAQ